MASKVGKKRPKARRANAERSATTRNKLITAAIDTLYRSGYSATTTIEIAKKAHVSRGAMLHQFPARVDLLLAVAHHIVETATAYRRERLSNEALDTPLKRFFVSSEISWEWHTQPSAIALLEIMMATRSDRDLRKGFAQFVRNWQKSRHAAAVRLAADLGAPDSVSQTEALVTLHQASMRGFAIELMFVRNRKNVEHARQLVSAYDRLFAEQLFAKGKAAQS